MINSKQVLGNGFVELQEVFGDDMAIVNAARVSYLGDSKGPDRDKKLLFYLMRNHHTSPFEMVQLRWRIKCPLFVARQWMRHRTWSYNEVSRRYTDESIEFYYPEEWRYQDNKNRQGSAGVWDMDLSAIYTKELREHCEESMRRYTAMLNEGVAREMARMVLPVNLMTTFVASVNAHNFMRFLDLRLDEHAQWEIRQYAQVMLEMFEDELPWTGEAYREYHLG